MKCPGEKELEMFFCEMLDSDKAAELKTHLDSCAECRDRLSEIRKLDGALGDMPVPLPGEDYWRTLAGRTAERYEKSRRTGFSSLRIINFRRAASMFWALTETAAVLVIAVAIYFFSNSAAVFSDMKPGEDSMAVSIENMQARVKLSGQAIQERTFMKGESFNSFDLSQIENL